MSDTMTQTNNAPTAESVMEQILEEMGGSLGLLLNALGVRLGIWASMSGAGPLTPAEVSERTGVAQPLSREWLRAQAAADYLQYDPVADTFTLPDAVAWAMLEGPGGAMIDACTHMLCSMGSGFAEFAQAFGSGAGFGWDRRTEDYWHGSDLLTRTALPPALIGSILDQIGPDVAEIGSVVDVGCGYGAPTMAVAEHLAGARVLGVDYHDVSVAHARRAAEQAGLSNRLRFEVAAATDLPGSGYGLITFFDSLHDLGDPVSALTVAREALTADGVVLLVEPLAGDHVEDNFHPAGRMFYAVSTLVCTPNAVSQQVVDGPIPLGTLAGEGRLREVAAAAGFTRVRRLPVEAPLNLVFELRV
jgi:SAM-dependent methyltransferase